jgi:acetyltransferase-like isoleucine patch superfamily enzyme
MPNKLLLSIHHLLRRLERRFDRERTRWYYSQIFGRIGSGCVIEPPLLLCNPDAFTIGINVQIRRGARLEAVTKYKGTRFNPQIVIGSGCTIEQGLHLTCAESVIIGDGVAITEYVGIFDILHGYRDPVVPIVDQPISTAAVRIGDHSMIGMGAVIQPGATIGKHCIIGANSVVIGDIPDYSVAVGIPARVIKQLDQATGEWKKIS